MILPIYERSYPVDMMNKAGLSWTEIQEFINMYLEEGDEPTLELSAGGHTSAEIPAHYPNRVKEILRRKNVVPFGERGAISWVRHYYPDIVFNKSIRHLFLFYIDVDKKLDEGTWYHHEPGCNDCDEDSNIDDFPEDADEGGTHTKWFGRVFRTLGAVIRVLHAAARTPAPLAFADVSDSHVTPRLVCLPLSTLGPNAHRLCGAPLVACERYLGLVSSLQSVRQTNQAGSFGCLPRACPFGDLRMKLPEESGFLTGQGRLGLRADKHYMALASSRVVWVFSFSLWLRFFLLHELVFGLWHTKDFHRGTGKVLVYILHCLPFRCFKGQFQASIIH